MGDLNSFFGVAGGIASIMGVLLAILLVRLPKPLYAMRIVRFGGVAHPDLSLHFQGQEISNLFLVRFVLWNGGKKEIRREDIPKPNAGPLLRFAENVRILSWTTNTSTGDDSGKFIKQGNDLLLDFEFLNRNDAFMGEAYLTTHDGAPPRTVLQGSFKGAAIAEGDIYNISRFDQVVFVIISAIFVVLTIVTGSFVVHAFSQHGAYFVKAGALLFFLITSSLTGIVIAGNVFSIPRKIPGKYLRFLESGR